MADILLGLSELQKLYGEFYGWMGFAKYSTCRETLLRRGGDKEIYSNLPYELN